MSRIGALFQLSVPLLLTGLPHDAWKCHGQLGAGVHVAKKDIRDCVAPLGSWKPGFQDRGNMISELADGQGPAAKQDDDCDWMGPLTLRGQGSDGPLHPLHPKCLHSRCVSPGDGLE